MEEREADRELKLGIALDHDVGVFPTTSPRLTVLGEQPLVSGLLGCGERGACSGLVGRVGSDALEEPVAADVDERGGRLRSLQDAALRPG